MNICKYLYLLYENKKKVLINEAHLTDTIPEQSTNTIFKHPFVHTLFKNILRSQVLISSRINLQISRSIVLDLNLYISIL